MPEHPIIDQLDFSRSTQYTLSIRISTDGFYFCIFNPIFDNSLYFIKEKVDPAISLAANFKKVTSGNSFLHHPYKQVIILLESKRHTIVPLELFEEEVAENYLYYNQPKEENEVVLYNILKRNNSVVVFSLNKSLYQLTQSLFGDPAIYLHTTPQAEYFAGKSKLGNNYKMYVNLRPGGMDLFCFERGKLLFFNSFPCQLPEDRSYYLLHVWKQLNLDQERDELHLSGYFTGRDELLTQLKRFVKQVFVVNPHSQYNYIIEHRAEEIPFDLQSVYLCEL